LILSHADSDHFNGIGELARRFPIGRVTMTPSFAEKPTIEVAAGLEVLREYQIPTRIVSTGDSFTAGEVIFDVLHPPAIGPPGTENERSLVLLVRHGEHRILLTGDLEKSGTPRLLQQPISEVDVLMAPHHGSLGAAPASLAQWCKPKLVVVSRGPALGNSVKPTDLPTTTLRDTFTDGAIILRSTKTSLFAETYLTGERMRLSR
jgi:competence protein ComEC